MIEMHARNQCKQWLARLAISLVLYKTLKGKRGGGQHLGFAYKIKQERGTERKRRKKLHR